jgi:hypothetical protein
MKRTSAVAAVAMAIALAPSLAQADSISSVEGARAHERQGRWLDRQEREQLRRWGGNDDYSRYYYRGPAEYYGGYGYAPAYRYRAYPY